MSCLWSVTAYMSLIALLVNHCKGLEMKVVPTSISVYVGGNVKISCNFQTSGETVDISWIMVYKNRTEKNKHVYYNNEITKLSDKTRLLPISNAQKNMSGLYICRVTVNETNKTFSSCGTYLRVIVPTAYLLNIGEATKNRIITAEGILLLLCAIIPGTFLLYKRFQHGDGYNHIWEASFPSSKANNNDYTSMTAVQLLAIHAPPLKTVKELSKDFYV